MFIESTIGKSRNQERKGHIEVICGSMFSGKTEELIRRLNRAFIAKQKVEIFKPSIDKRYHDTDVVSHNDNAIRSTPVQFADDIILLAGDCDVVGIDEVQFFDNRIVHVANVLANSGFQSTKSMSFVSSPSNALSIGKFCDGKIVFSSG